MGRKKPEKKQPKPRGRPTNFNERIRDKILALAEKGCTDDEIAKEVGISVRALNYWKAKDIDFMQSIRESKSIADDMVEASLFQRAIGYSHKATKFFQYEGCIIAEDYEEHYPPDTKAIEFWLKNRKPKAWRDKQEIEHTGVPEPTVIKLFGNQGEVVLGTKKNTKIDDESEDAENESDS